MTPIQRALLSPAAAGDPSVLRPWPGWFVWLAAVIGCAGITVVALGAAFCWGLWVSGEGFGVYLGR